MGSTAVLWELVSPYRHDSPERGCDMHASLSGFRVVGFDTTASTQLDSYYSAPEAYWWDPSAAPLPEHPSSLGQPEQLQSRLPPIKTSRFGRKQRRSARGEREAWAGEGGIPQPQEQPACTAQPAGGDAQGSLQWRPSPFDAVEAPAPAPFATAATQPQAIPGGLKRSISAAAAAAAAAAPRSSPVSAAGFPTSDASSPLSTEQQEEEERELPPEAASGSAGGSHTPPCKPLSLFVQLTEARDEATRAQERERKLEDALRRERAEVASLQERLRRLSLEAQCQEEEEAEAPMYPADAPSKTSRRRGRGRGGRRQRKRAVAAADA